MVDVGYLSPFIIIVIYIIAEIYKRVFAKKAAYKNWLPIICAVLGGIMGFLIYKFYPQGIVQYADNAIGAIGNGAFSGLAATGCNQIYKQIKKFKLELFESEDDTTTYSDNSNNDTNGDA